MFALATREELWSFADRPVLLESRLSYGIAEQQGRVIHARDERDDELVERCARLVDRAIRAADGRACRIVADARRIDGVVRERVTLTLARGALSVLTTPEYRSEDAALLDAHDARATLTVDHRELPILWRNGSASVLLHEAIGHAAEHECAALAWPAWLAARDVPEDSLDDCGRATRVTDLLHEAPASLRRETFRDVPLPRMSNLVIEQHGAPFELPPRRIDVHLLDGGAFDPLTDEVRVHVSAATFVDGDEARALAPFDIVESRASVARALRGARGDATRYPGVVCGREGQSVVVGSHAPELLTFFA